LNQPYDDMKTGDGIPGTEKINAAFNRSAVVRRMGAKLVFFFSWFLLLAACAGLAAVKNFDPGICRHLSIGLVLLYFIFVYISYKHSPLVASSEKTWWGLRTGKPLDIIISNPVKVLLSISMLAVFVFIDIGFAIVFLNFLLFNEAFLCINYSIAGYSAGSRKNAGLFGLFGFAYLAIFLINLLYAPAILNKMLDLPQTFYIGAYILFAVIIAQNFTRLLTNFSSQKKVLTGFVAASLLLASALLFFPKDKILEKAEITRYRINVMSMPVDKAIESAYRDGKTWEPVIRAAQNQWFINTFIYEKNNPAVQTTGFHLLPHSPQNKGAKYNAQASDLVTSRFFIAEHGKLSVLLFVLLLMLPISLLASFYKLYPDFTNRINSHYPTITAGFSVLNYLLITAMLVILAATGRYIFFGQDLPFGSIISKQSVLFPSILIITAVLLFRNIQLEHYPNRKKLLPGLIVLSCVGGLLFLVKPVYNKNRDFTVNNLAKDMDAYIQMRLQPVLDYFDSSRKTRRMSFANKDRLFTDSLRTLLDENYLQDAGGLFNQEIESYTRSGFNGHLDQRKLLYLDLYSGRPQLAVNDNYFHIEPPPHLQQYWTGNVFGDSTVFNLSYWDSRTGYVAEKRLDSYTNQPLIPLTEDLDLSFRASAGENLYGKLWIVNKGKETLHLNYCCEEHELTAGDSLQLFNPDRISITDAASHNERILVIEPDAFMKNYYVNGGRYFIYPMQNRFVWARNFSESVSSEYTRAGTASRNAFLSFDFELMDSLSARIKKVIGRDTAYKKGSEYGICIADGNGRLVAMTDFIKDFNRPDPNDKAGFVKAIQGENGFISQSLLRKQIGNINLLRMNPGPGSTFKPIVFSAIASQLNIDWD
ncbi:MAG TPA: hypothetical protein VLJ68_14315, partial [Chitinophagaceae bacterium]|nr:hypothetical protein [Chitinophagaceae bacterium]